MSTADGRIILFIAIAFALFAVGRRYQQMIDLWAKWRNTVAAIPGLRRSAWSGVRAMVKIAALAALVFWAVTNINRFI